MGFWHIDLLPFIKGNKSLEYSILPTYIVTSIKSWPSAIFLLFAEFDNCECTVTRVLHIDRS